MDVLVIGIKADVDMTGDVYQVSVGYIYTRGYKYKARLTTLVTTSHQHYALPSPQRREKPAV